MTAKNTGPLGIAWIESSENVRQYYIEAHTDRLKNGEVWLNGDIDRATIETSVMRLLTLAYSRKFERLTVVINSPGGNVDEGFALIDTILNLPIPVWTLVIGEAASMGLSVFLAGERRFAFPHANFMAHSISYGKGGDKLDEQESYLEYVKLKQAQHAEYYANRTKKRNYGAKWWLAKYKEADFYFDTEEAKKLGIVTDIVDSPEVLHEIFEGSKAEGGK